MRILFLHQNFPAQWVHLAKHYAALPNHEVVAITDDGNRNPDIVRTLRYRAAPPDLKALPQSSIRFGNNIARGKAAAEVMLKLKHEGFAPDVVAGHCGWGETLFVKEVWPNTKLLLYGEYFYRANGADFGFDNEFDENDADRMFEVPSYNATTMLAVASADKILTPTIWQRNTFPQRFHSAIEVIHEGIDTETVQPKPHTFVMMGRDKLRLTAADEIITFISRNLEPYRGYHIFMRALPKIMSERAKARVIIFGGDKVSYGRAPPAGKTWRSIFLEEVKDKIDMSRIHLVGQVPHQILWDALSISSCHVYFTYPFVLSWSLIEAMSMSCLIVGSATPPVQEVIAHGKNGLLVDFFDVEQLATQVVEVLSRPAHYEQLRHAARSTAIGRYDLRSRCLPQMTSLVDRLLDC